MPLNGNSSHMAVIARRRENVGRLRLRGLSQREIITALTRVKDTDGSPDPIKASLGTVNRDLKVLEAEWRAHAAARGIDPDKVVDQVNKARLILEAPVATSDEPG